MLNLCLACHLFCIILVCHMHLKVNQERLTFAQIHYIIKRTMEKKLTYKNHKELCHEFFMLFGHCWHTYKMEFYEVCACCSSYCLFVTHYRTRGQTSPLLYHDDTASVPSATVVGAVFSSTPLPSCSSSEVVSPSSVETGFCPSPFSTGFSVFPSFSSLWNERIYIC